MCSLTRQQVVGWLMLAGAVGLSAWYARPQLVYSLSFMYQLARHFFPELVPDVGAPG